MTLTAPHVAATRPARRSLLARPTAAGDPGTRTDIDALGVRIDRLDAAEARARVAALRRRPGCARVVFVNAHSLNLSHDDPSYRAALARADLVLNDGIGVAVLGRALGTPFPANLNGTDFVPQVLTDLPSGATVFLYGGRAGVAERAAEQLGRRHPDLVFVGAVDGYQASAQDAADAVARSGAEVVLVALGNPRQELWADAFGARTGATLVLSVGAFLDFSAGEVRRAPGWLRTLRLEWAFRLLCEPKRLFRRYLWGIPVFLSRVARLRWAGPARAGVVLYEYPPERWSFAA